MVIEKVKLGLLSPEGFNNRVCELASNGISRAKAYTMAEAEFFEVFDRNRYSNYDSFKNALSKRLRKSKPNKITK